MTDWQKICPEDSHKFHSWRRDAVYCSPACRQVAYRRRQSERLAAERLAADPLNQLIPQLATDYHRLFSRPWEHADAHVERQGPTCYLHSQGKIQRFASESELRRYLFLYARSGQPG